ncbi:T9SS type A sorting domain-containing protein [Mangrovimonas futianensis]|uniref:T9SS type A sorting domain-containing protein n=1 Tax=Mangrovimonas futianensis TaxID=2895523 RepID=UPI001E4A196D|nr:T9SS type A sorting domain-containing protein [Mangrovimonas futianensis]MCF1420062.1 T9SS type A sorting domain-containing protein [Mangrovimonas futianensis]
MKHTYLLFVLFSLSVQSQIINFPDQTFKDQLLASSPSNQIAKNLSGSWFQIDANSDGEIQESEALEVSYISVSGYTTEVNNSILNDITGIEYFTNLTHLTCSPHEISYVDLSQNTSLTYLDFSEPLSSTLNWYTLNELDVTNCSNLAYLDISGNGLESIDLSQNVNLTTLKASYNAFMELDISQTEINEFFIQGNSLPYTFIGNEELEVFANSFGKLGHLDVSLCSDLLSIFLEDVGIHSINLGYHPLLTWIYLSVSSNFSEIDLSAFPNLENFNLEEYWEEDDFFVLTHLDFSDNFQLQDISISSSSLESVNLKNGISEETIDIYNYSSSSLNFICADEFQVLELSDIFGDEVVVHPYCSFTPGGNYNTTTGQVLFDLNNDGCQTGTESFSNVLIQVESEDSEEVSYVNSGGNYSFYSQNGSFILTPSIEHPDWFNISPENAIVVFEDNLNNTTSQDFCISALGTHQDLEVVLTPIGNAQPGFDADYELIYKNNGNQMTSGQVSLSFGSSLMELVSVSQEQNDLNDGELIWNFEDLLPFESRSTFVTFNLNAPTETPSLNIDDVLTFSVEIVGAQEDENPDDNSFELNQTVVGAFDPNDKVCLEGDIAPIEKIGDYLHYTINFENIGNAAATFVVIKDVLNESDYNLNSLQILSASHSMETRMEGNLLEFYFDNIDLGPEEQGHVSYKIKTLESLEVGDTVSNSAEIYFDYNLPIETNEAITSFESLSLIENTAQEGSIKIFPNPTFGEVMIVSPSSPIQLLEVLDMNGRILNSLELNKRRTICDLSAYQKGVYFVKIKTQDGVYGSKVIKN